MSWKAQISRSIKELRVALFDVVKKIVNRDFFFKGYKELKTLNPNTPFVFRESHNADPIIYVRYDWGQFDEISVHGKEPKEIDSILKKSILKGLSMPRSPESDIYVKTPIISSNVDLDNEYINLTWDGKTVRKNPYVDEDDEEDDPEIARLVEELLEEKKEQAKNEEY